MFSNNFPLDTKVPWFLPFPRLPKAIEICHVTISSWSPGSLSLVFRPCICKPEVAILISGSQRHDESLSYIWFDKHMNYIISSLATRRLALSTEGYAWHPIGVNSLRQDVPEFMWIHELQQIPQKDTHSSTFPCRAIANASLSQRQLDWVDCIWGPLKKPVVL